MAIWIKDTGGEIELNDEPATVAHAESLGWKRKAAKKAPAKKAAPKTKK